MAIRARRPPHQGRLGRNRLVVMNEISFLVPGDPCTRTGGFLYDAKISAGLRDLGWKVDILQLHDGFPEPDAAALEHAAKQLEKIDDHAIVVIDGLAFGAMPSVVEHHRHRLRLIALVHHPLAAETGIDDRLRQEHQDYERRALRFAHHVIVTSAHTAAALTEHYAVASEKLSVVQPGTDRPGYLGRAAHERRDVTTSCRTNKPFTANLLCVATLTPRKGHQRLINALAPLADLRWQLRCVGSTERSPGTTQQIVETINAAGLSDRVALLGEVDDEQLRECYNWADAFVLATHMEGYGMALAEAIVHGLPVITTAGGAAATTVGSQAALLVEDDDDETLTRALKRMMAEPELRIELAAAADRQALQLPTWRDSSTAMHQVLSQLQRR